MLNFDKKKILIYGLGITGVSSYDYLKKKMKYMYLMIILKIFRKK